MPWRAAEWDAAACRGVFSLLEVDCKPPRRNITSFVNVARCSRRRTANTKNTARYPTVNTNTNTTNITTLRGSNVVVVAVVEYSRDVVVLVEVEVGFIDAVEVVLVEVEVGFIDVVVVVVVVVLDGASWQGDKGVRVLWLLCREKGMRSHSQLMGGSLLLYKLEGPAAAILMIWKLDVVCNKHSLRHAEVWKIKRKSPEVNGSIFVWSCSHMPLRGKHSLLAGNQAVRGVPFLSCSSRRTPLKSLSGLINPKIL